MVTLEILFRPGDMVLFKPTAFAYARNESLNILSRYFRVAKFTENKFIGYQMSVKEIFTVISTKLNVEQTEKAMSCSWRNAYKDLEDPWYWMMSTQGDLFVAPHSTVCKV